MKLQVFSITEVLSVAGSTLDLDNDEQATVLHGSLERTECFHIYSIISVHNSRRKEIKQNMTYYFYFFYFASMSFIFF